MEYYEDIESKDNTYYITIPFKNPNNDEFSDGFLYDVVVSNRAFFKHSVDEVAEYVRDYSPNFIPDTSKLEIVQTKFCYYKKNGFYVANVLIKTFCLRLIQRRWRNVLKKRRQILNTYYKNIKNMEMGTQQFHLPELKGCLSDLKALTTIL